MSRRQRRDLTPDNLLRWFVCNAEGHPTGWACGVTSNSARHAYAEVYAGRTRLVDLEERWVIAARQGYTVQPFLLVPLYGPPAPEDVA
jgi:hypothetical protein